MTSFTKFRPDIQVLCSTDIADTQLPIDGTQLYSTKNELDEKGLYWIHNRGTVDKYHDNYYYVLEDKLVLHKKIIVSIMAEFVDNENGEESIKTKR